MIDQSHIDSFLAYESEPNVFNIDANAFHIDPFPYEILTMLGNEKSFMLTHVKELAGIPLVGKYQQIDSPLILYVFT